jgi:hypothetical protein
MWVVVSARFFGGSGTSSGLLARTVARSTSSSTCAVPGRTGCAASRRERDTTSSSPSINCTWLVAV